MQEVWQSGDNLIFVSRCVIYNLVIGEHCTHTKLGTPLSAGLLHSQDYSRRFARLSFARYTYCDSQQEDLSAEILEGWSSTSSVVVVVVLVVGRLKQHKLCSSNGGVGGGNNNTRWFRPVSAVTTETIQYTPHSSGGTIGGGGSMGRPPPLTADLIRIGAPVHQCTKWLIGYICIILIMAIHL